MGDDSQFQNGHWGTFARARKTTIWRIARDAKPGGISRRALYYTLEGNFKVVNKATFKGIARGFGLSPRKLKEMIESHAVARRNGTAL